jgi:hypothetical protein
MFSCNLFSMIYVSFFLLNLCDLHYIFWAWILVLLHVSHILICMYQVSFKIFLFSVVYVLIAMNHCKHSHKRTGDINSFFFDKVVQNCTEKVKRRLFICRFLKISANLITPPKRVHQM